LSVGRILLVEMGYACDVKSDIGRFGIGWCAAMSVILGAELLIIQAYDKAITVFAHWFVGHMTWIGYGLLVLGVMLFGYSMFRTKESRS